MMISVGFFWSLLDSIAEKFHYLIKKKPKEGQEVRRVAQFDWKIIEGSCEKPFVASGLQFVPLPVTCYKLLNLMKISCI